jgi:pimeloyl-ACP methyl ester carboxylesterase
VFVHGSGCGAQIWDGWPAYLAGRTVDALDLQEGLDPGRASMEDYAAAVRRGVRRAPPSAGVAVVAWSMGGLVAMLAVQEVPVDLLVLMDPSAPSQLRTCEDLPPAGGVYAPYAEFPHPPELVPRPESTLASRQRSNGIDIPRLPDRTCVVSSYEAPWPRAAGLAKHYGTRHLAMPRHDHFEIVLAEDAIATIVAAVLPPRQPKTTT